MSDYLSDIALLLCDLNGAHQALVRKQFLPVSALHRLNPLLSQPDPAPTVAWRNEYATQRLRVLHFLAACAGLLAPSGGLLLPTLNASKWLTQPYAQQREMLVQAITAQVGQGDDQAVLDLWCNFRLPGWKLLKLQGKPTFRFLPLLELLQLPGPLSLQTCANRVSFALISTHADLQPMLPVRAYITLLLALFGCTVLPDASHVDIPPDLAAILTRSSPAASAATVTRPVTLICDDAKFSLAQLALPLCFALGRYANIEAPSNYPTDPLSHCPTIPLCFRLDRDRVHRALLAGESRVAIVQWVQQAFGEQAAAACGRSLKRYERQIKPLSLRQVWLLSAAEPARITQLLAARGTRACVSEQLSSQAVLIHADRLPTLARRLQRLGLYVPLALAVAPAPAPVALGQDALLQLYVSALLCHHLPEVLALHYRVNSATLSALAKHLSADQQAHAQHIVRTQLQQLGPPPPAAAPDHDPLTQLSQAIQRQQALIISYEAGEEGILSQRLIRPLRLETGERHHYLIAHCHLANAERRFRLDRILAIDDAVSNAL